MTRMMKRLIVVAALTALLVPATYAGDAGDPGEKCDGSTPEMVDCLAARTARWDKRMTMAYQQAMKDASAQQHDRLRAAQRLWIQYRDANCLCYSMGEGTIARVNAGECMRSMTEARARELEKLAQQ